MSGTLSSLNTALTALRYNRVAMDVASNNIANATTRGHSRRHVDGVALGATAQPAMWSRYQGAGGGVDAGPVQRMVDPFLDARARSEHGSQSYLDLRSGVLQRVESGIGEPGDSGVASALAGLRAAWQDVANHPEGEAARSQVLARAGTLVDSLHAQATNIATERSDQCSRLRAMVTGANTAAGDLAATNDSVAVAHLNGTESAELLDQRDALAMMLAQLTGGVATTRPDGGLDVSIQGVALVTGKVAGHLDIASGVTPTGADDGNPVGFAIVTGAASAVVPAGVRGEVGAVTDLLDTTLPAYLTGLGSVAQMVADETNAQHVSGFDLAGNPGMPLFSYNPADVAGTLAVVVTDPSLVAVSGVSGGVLDGSNADALGQVGSADAAYQRLVNGFGTEVASVKRLALTQQMLTTQVDGSREQLSGVNLEEETVAMLSSQRAYEAASRVISVMDSVLDTLINRTGLLR